MTTDTDIAALDAADPLASFHDAFSLPDGVIYLCGNSLGPPPRDAAARLARVTADQWGAHLVRGWTEDGWIGLPGRVGDKVAQLIGANPGEVAIADSTSVIRSPSGAASRSRRTGVESSSRGRRLLGGFE